MGQIDRARRFSAAIVAARASAQSLCAICDDVETLHRELSDMLTNAARNLTKAEEIALRAFGRIESNLKQDYMEALLSADLGLPDESLKEKKAAFMEIKQLATALEK